MAGGDDGLLGRRGRAALLSADYSHRSRLDKLGVRAGAAVRLCGLDDAQFESELAARGVRLAAAPPLDLVVLLAERTADLDRLAELRTLIRPAGAIWVLRPKGNSRAVSEIDIIEAGKRHGLVDNKIASFSETLSAMRLVVPVASRDPSGGAAGAAT